MAAVWWMMVWSVIYPFFSTSHPVSARKLVGKWQLQSNQLSRDAQKLGIIPVRDIEGKPAFWSTQVYPGNVFPTSRCVAHSMQWNVVLKMTLANHPCKCLILIDLNICQTTISTMNSSSFLGGGLEYFLFSPLPGDMIQFDEHIFEMGWFNHQPEILIICIEMALLLEDPCFFVVPSSSVPPARSWVVSFQEVFPRVFFYAKNGWYQTYWNVRSQVDLVKQNLKIFKTCFTIEPLDSAEFDLGSISHIIHVRYI